MALDPSAQISTVGGPGGYEEFRVAVADINHERHHELVETWCDAHHVSGDVDTANHRKNEEALAAKWKRRSRKRS